MTRLLLPAIALLTLASCASVIRDEHTYRQEHRFLGAVSDRIAGQLLEEAAEAARVGSPGRCERLANDALVAHVRVPYHLAMSLHLAGLGDDPGEPPPVPSAVEWCAARAQEVTL